jgi:hypothetical protein
LAIECFNIEELVSEFVLIGIKFPFGEGVKHERVVGIGTVSDSDHLFRHGSLLKSDENGFIVSRM